MITDVDSRDQDADGELAIGWTAFAGVALLLLAVLNAVEGIAAISDSQFFADGDMIIGDLQTWGWVLCAIAVVQLLAAPWLWMSIPIARFVGAGVAAVNAIVQMLFIPAYPFWSLPIFALNIGVLYALTVHGKQRGS